MHKKNILLASRTQHENIRSSLTSQHTVTYTKQQSTKTTEWREPKYRNLLRHKKYISLRACKVG
jgi:hypothetical protein